jgi:hypothetical protein
MLLIYYLFVALAALVDWLGAVAQLRVFTRDGLRHPLQSMQLAQQLRFCLLRHWLYVFDMASVGSEHVG